MIFFIITNSYADANIQREKELSPTLSKAISYPNSRGSATGKSCRPTAGEYTDNTIQYNLVCHLRFSGFVSTFSSIATQVKPQYPPVKQLESPRLIRYIRHVQEEPSTSNSVRR